jgi:hypothetical protein
MTTYKISVNQQYRGETRELTPIPLMSESGIGKVPLKLINVFPTHLTAGDPEGDSHPVVDACDRFFGVSGIALDLSEPQKLEMFR